MKTLNKGDNSHLKSNLDRICLGNIKLTEKCRLRVRVRLGLELGLGIRFSLGFELELERH
jgi:hypothetical protein